MTGTGDDVPEMPAAPLLDEVTIDAIVDGDAPQGVCHLAAFAAGVLAVGDEPPPQPSPELAAFLAHGGPTLAVERATVVLPAVTRRRSVLARVAGVSLVAKISVATTAAAAGVVGAGAAGMLPGPAGGFVRDAIEVVTPVEFTDDDSGGGPDRGDADPSDEPGTAPGDLGDAQVPSLPGEHGDRVSSDATGDSDGDPGVDGPTVAEQAPGAATRRPFHLASRGRRRRPPPRRASRRTGRHSGRHGPRVRRHPRRDCARRDRARRDRARVAGQPSAGRSDSPRSVTAPRAGAPPRRAVHPPRPGHLTPWARPPATTVDRRPAWRSRPAPPPVFVDDSGRRRRAGRMLGTCLAALVSAYVAVVGLTFSGAPLVGRLAPPGVEELSRPAGDAGVDVGPGAQVSPLPPAATGPGARIGSRRGRPVRHRRGGDRRGHDATSTAVPTATTIASTTTTTTPGRSTHSTEATPSSTVPEHSTGGPPAEPPGKP